VAANTSPIFSLVPVAKSVSITTATTDNPLRAGTGVNFGTVLSAGANGTRIDRITATGTATTVATQVLLFVFDGTTNFFFKELTLAAVTASTTTAAAAVELIRTDGLPVIAIPSGYSLKAAITVAPSSGAIIVTGFGGDF
jgi:hypothetical protein